MSLPEPTPEQEDATVEQWRLSDDTHGLLAMITEAMEAKRIQLAARLVGLLDDHVEITPGSEVHRAQKAAKLLLVTVPNASAQQDLEEAWRLARTRRMRRHKRRTRKLKRGQERRQRVR